MPSDSLASAMKCFFVCVSGSKRVTGSNQPLARDQQLKDVSEKDSVFVGPNRPNRVPFWANETNHPTVAALLLRQKKWIFKPWRSGGFDP